MEDPAERLQRFVAKHKGSQATETGAEIQWQAKLPRLFVQAEKLVNIFHEAGHNDLRIEVRHGQLALAFGQRPCGINPAGDKRVDFDTDEGASAIFLQNEGRVHGYRKPFHPMNQATSYELFAELDAPSKLSETVFGNAVAEFLEWAAVGAGCGRKKLDF